MIGVSSNGSSASAFVVKVVVVAASGPLGGDSALTELDDSPISDFKGIDGLISSLSCAPGDIVIGLNASFVASSEVGDSLDSEAKMVRCRGPITW